MSIVPTSPRVLSIALEPGGARFLLSRQNGRSLGGGVLVEKAEYAAYDFPSSPGLGAGEFHDLASFLAAKRDAMVAGEAADAAGGASVPVRIALPPDAAFFRFWEFPFRSGRKVRRAASLLLETELPFPASAMVSCLCPAGRSGNMRHTLAVALLRDRLDALNEALRERGIVPETLTVQPFPLLGVLPIPHEANVSEARGGGRGVAPGVRSAARRLRECVLHRDEGSENDAALCLLIQGRAVTLARTGHGRVRNVLHSGFRWPGEPLGAEQTSAMGKALLNEAEMLFSDAPFRKIFVAGDAASCAVAAHALSEASGLAATCLTREKLPFSLAFAPGLLPGGASVDGWTCEWAMALGLARAGSVPVFGRAVFLPAALRRVAPKQPDFAPGGTVFQYSGLASAFTGRWGRVALWLLPLAAAWGFALWAGAHGLRAEAELVERKMRESFQRAVPEVQTRFGTGQMLAILKERIAAHEGRDGAQAPVFGTLDILRAVHDVSPADVQVTLNSISIDRQRVLLSGSAPDFTHIERFRKALSEAAELGTARILSASAQKQQERVNFEIDCARRALP